MESWLTQITNYLLTQSWQISVLTIAVVIASIILRNRSAHVRYLLWLIVLAKCLAPPIYSIQLPVLPHEEPPVYVPASPMPESTIAEYREPEASLTESAGTASVPSEVVSSPGVIKRPAMYDTRAWLAMGWFAGVVALSFYYLLNALRTQIWLQKRRKALPSESGGNIESFFTAYGVRRMPRVWLLDRISQPFVWGLVRGSIYLPAELLDDKHAKFHASLLTHELSHVIRFDAMINSLQVIAQTVFWVNRKIRSEREKCCDEMTIVRLNALPEEYSEAIVETLAAKHEQGRPVPSLAVAGQVKNIEERIKTMLKPGKKFYIRPSLIAATVVLLLALLTVPTALVLSSRAEVKTPAPLEEKPDTLGKLEYIDHWSSDEYLARCTSLELSPDGRHIYVTAYGSRCVAVFGRDEMTGYIKRLDTIPLKGAFATRVSPNGRYVVCSDVGGGSERWAGSNSVSLFERDQLSGNLILLDSIKNGDNNIDSLDYVVDICFSLNSEFVYVIGSRSAAVTAFRITDDKKLALVQSDKGQDQCFDGGRGIAVSPDGKYVYVASVDAGTLAVLQRDAETGKISLKQVFKDEQGDVHGLCGVWDVTCSLDGRFVYTNAGGGGLFLNVADRPEEKDDTICVFKRMVDGTLSLVQEIRGDEGGIGLVGGSRLFMSPDGKQLYALGMYSNSIVAFRQDPKTGKLNYIQTHSFQRIGKKYVFPADLGISPDGAYVYVVGEGIGLNGIVLLKRLPWTKKGTEKTLYEAACSGDRSLLESAIKKGADINSRGQGGYTALHWAAQENQKQAATLLLDAGAYVNARTGESGWTPLHIAAMKSNQDVGKILIDRGADLQAENKNNRKTPIVIARRAADLDFASFLLDEGARLDVRDRWGWTPLHHAAAEGDIAFADLLIGKGADINATDDGGHTPLFFALRWNEVQMTEWLISKGADVNAKDQQGRTLLEFFTKGIGFTDQVELLRKHGAKE